MFLVGRQFSSPPIISLCVNSYQPSRCSSVNSLPGAADMWMRQFRSSLHPPSLFYGHYSFQRDGFPRKLMADGLWEREWRQAVSKGRWLTLYSSVAKGIGRIRLFWLLLSPSLSSMVPSSLSSTTVPHQQLPFPLSFSLIHLHHRFPTVSFATFLYPSPPSFQTFLTD